MSDETRSLTIEFRWGDDDADPTFEAYGPVPDWFKFSWLDEVADLLSCRMNGKPYQYGYPQYVVPVCDHYQRETWSGTGPEGFTKTVKCGRCGDVLAVRVKRDHGLPWELVEGSERYAHD